MDTAMLALSDSVWTALIAAVVNVVTVLLGMWKMNGKLDAVHQQFNSRMDEYLSLAKKSSHAEGVKDAEDAATDPNKAKQAAVDASK